MARGVPDRGAKQSPVVERPCDGGGVGEGRCPGNGGRVLVPLIAEWPGSRGSHEEGRGLSRCDGAAGGLGADRRRRGYMALRASSVHVGGHPQTRVKRKNQFSSVCLCSGG